MSDLSSPKSVTIPDDTLQLTKTPEGTKKTPERTTKTPERTKNAVEGSSKTPERTKKTLDGTTKTPERTKKNVEGTTKTPERTKKSSEGTTKTPERTKKSSEGTTKTPERTKRNEGTTRSTNGSKRSSSSSSGAPIPLTTIPSTPWAPAITDALNNKPEVIIKSLHAFHRGKFQVLDENKSVLFQVKAEEDPSHGLCCSRFRKREEEEEEEEEETWQYKKCFDIRAHPMTFYARAIAGHEVLVAERKISSQTCCLRFWTFDVILRPDIQIGSIVNDSSWRNFVLKNPSGDRLLTVKAEHGCFKTPLYKVLTLDGTEVGEINVNTSKTHLVFKKDIEIKSKILLLIFAISVQNDQEQLSLNGSSQNHQHQVPY